MGTPTHRLQSRLHAQLPSPNLTVCRQLGDDKPNGVGRNREADSLRRADDRRVDPNHVCGAIHEGTSRIARIEREVGYLILADNLSRTRISICKNDLDTTVITNYVVIGHDEPVRRNNDA